MMDLFKLPKEDTSTFLEAYLNPATITFAAKVLTQDGTYTPVIYLSSGMKLAVPDDMFRDIINASNVILPEVPKAVRDAFPDWPSDKP